MIGILVMPQIQKKNPGRKFLICPKYKMKNEQCDYFLRVDCENCNRLGMLVKLLLGLLVFSWILFCLLIVIRVV